MISSIVSLMGILCSKLAQVPVEPKQYWQNDLFCDMNGGHEKIKSKMDSKRALIPGGAHAALHPG